MLRSRKQVALLSLAFGLAAAGLTAYYTMRVTEAAQPTERLVVAKANIPSRTKVTEEMVTIKSLPAGARLPEASASTATFIGKTTRQPIFAGEQVLASRFFNDRAESGLAFVIPPGHRAMAVGITEESGVGGHIAAGDKVDLIATCTAPALEKSQQAEISKAVWALQNVEVLAVARKVVGEEDAGAPQGAAVKTALAAGSRARPVQEVQAKTITLSLTPAEAETVALLDSNQACRLRFALRSSGDTATVGTRETVFNPVQPLAAAPAR